LIEHLNAGLDRKLTLIAAPAGFGKTTLLSEWIPQSPRCVTWLSLDGDDNDPTKFWTYFITSLRGLHPELGESAFNLLQSPQVPPISSFLTTLINDLAAFPDAFAIVLDDYHLIRSQPIHEAFAYLIANLPDNMHLVMTTRADPPLPLARLRARDKLTELRASELRFTANETAIFLTRAMGLKLTENEIDALDARTEGWIAGLQIAALSMQGNTDISGFILAFSGSHRHILGYLADEVLTQQPERTLNFLLKTSILDRLCGPLCDVVTGDSDGQAILENLEDANLFINLLDDQRTWYRYHPLFADLLRHRLQQTYPDQVPKLHLSASQWYEQAGFIDQAVQHALDAQAFKQAAVLVEQVVPTMMQRSQITRLLLWLDTLPEEEVHARPLLTLYQVWILYISGQIEQVEPRLETVEAMLVADESKSTPEVQAHIAALRAFLAREAGELEASISLSRQGLAHLPEQNVLLRAMVTLNLAIAQYLQDELEPVSQLLTEFIASSQTIQLVAPTSSAIFLKAQTLRARGSLQQALLLCQEGLEFVTRRGWQDFPAAGYLYVAYGNLLFEQNELKLAQEYLERGIELGQKGGHYHILVSGYVWLALLRQTQLDVSGSQEAIQAALQLSQQDPGSRFWPLPSAVCTQARLWIAQGNLATASHWAQESGLDPMDCPVTFLYEVDCLTLARLLIAQGNPQEAETLLMRLHQRATTAERKGSLIEILILQSFTLAAQKRSEQALLALEQALNLAEPEGYIRIFVHEGDPMRLLLSDFQSILRQRIGTKVDNTSLRFLSYTDKLLAAFSQSIAIPIEAHGTLLDPPSERELEILRLIAAGHSNREIAELLVIAQSTVKWYINGLYSKLGAKSRTHALALARELKLI